MIDTRILRSAGLTEAQIIRIVEIDQEERRARRREQNRIYQQKQRARQHLSTLSILPIANTPSPPSPPSNGSPIIPPITTPSSSPPSTTEGARARGDGKGMRIPPDWAPSSFDLEFASRLLVAEEVSLETEKFRDYWQARAGPNGVKRDWAATWRNWCRKASESKRMNGNGKYRESLGDIGRRLAARARELESAAGAGGTDDPFGSH